jgi:hypothetical protein
MHKVVAVVLAVVALSVHAAAVRVTTGGVGVEEREALERDPAYNLKVVAVAQSGQYLADVEVRILDARGAPVVETRTNGPWLMAELPPGRYRLVASFGGASQARDFTAASPRQVIVLRWNVPADYARPGDGPGVIR